MIRKVIKLQKHLHMKSFSIAAGAALLTLSSASIASAASLQLQGTISGQVVSSVNGGNFIDPRLGVDIGDPIQGSFSAIFDDSVFLNADPNDLSINVPLTTLNLSVGEFALTIENPIVDFVRDQDFFVFNAVSADSLSYQVNSRNVYVGLTGGEFPGGVHGGGYNRGEGYIFALGSPGWASGNSSVRGEAGLTETCEGTGCRFRVKSTPEPSSILGLVSLSTIAISSMRTRNNKKSQAV